MKSPRVGPFALAPALAVLAMASPVAPLAAQTDEQAAEAVPIRCHDLRLESAERRAIARGFVDALWSAYASGDVEGLRSVTTEQGYEALLASDWRTRSVADGMLTFDEAARLRELNDFEDLCLDGTELVATRLDMVVVIEPGGSLLAGPLPIESSQGEKRTGLVATFLAPETADGAWLVDAIGPTAFEMPYVAQRPARPCPGLGNPRRASDPFTMRPWCDANGDGRFVRPWTGDPGGELAVDRPEGCGEGVVEVILGLPPGLPVDSLHSGDYLRDPRGEAHGLSSFRRDFRPPQDAISTGITNGYLTIWSSASLGDEFLLVEVGDHLERWPHSTGPCAG